MLSRRAKSALHALLALAANPGRSLRTQELQALEGGSRAYLEATLSALVRAELVESLRGRTGGFRLARAPETVSFAEVIRLFDGPLALAPCASRTVYRRCDDCRDEALCGVRGALIAAREQAAAVLEGMTLAQALVDAGPGAYSAGAISPEAVRLRADIVG